MRGKTEVSPYQALLAPIEKRVSPTKLENLLENAKTQIGDAESRISTIESQFTTKFEQESSAALERLRTAVQAQQEKLESSIRRGLMGLAGAVIVIGLVAIGAIYQTAQTQVAKAGVDFQKDLAGAYKEISAARLEASKASAEIQGQEERLKGATDAAEVEVKRLKTLPPK